MCHIHKTCQTVQTKQRKWRHITYAVFQECVDKVAVMRRPACNTQQPCSLAAALTLTPWCKVAPMPTKHPSSKVTPCRQTPCPTVTEFPMMVRALKLSRSAGPVLITTPSCRLLSSPMVTEAASPAPYFNVQRQSLLTLSFRLRVSSCFVAAWAPLRVSSRPHPGCRSQAIQHSPLTTVPYHMEDFEPTLTWPDMAAEGAIKLLGLTSETAFGRLSTALCRKTASHTTKLVQLSIRNCSER